MTLKIRLARGGAKKRPYYRIVVADSTAPRDGRFIEKIGAWNPMLPKGKTDRVTLDTERAKHWLSGRRPADRPGGALPRCLRPAAARRPQQSEQGAAGQEADRAREGRGRGAQGPRAGGAAAAGLRLAVAAS